MPHFLPLIREVFVTIIIIIIIIIIILIIRKFITRA